MGQAKTEGKKLNPMRNKFLIMKEFKWKQFVPNQILNFILCDFVISARLLPSKAQTL